MTAAELARALELELCTPEADLSRTISGACACDLLSWALAKGRPGAAWITVQTHSNVPAVARLGDFACVILAHNCRMDEQTLLYARRERICVFSSPLCSFELCGRMHALGIGGFSAL